MRKALTWALVRALLVTAAFGLVHQFVHPSATFVTAPDTQAQFIEHLMRVHGCWRNDGRPHPIPGHVLAFWHGSIHFGGAHLTKVALDAIFNGGHRHLSVFGFCR